MTTRPKSVYLSDHWTTLDALEFDVFIPALIDVLENAETPLTLGIFGSWGTGKTSLLRMLEKKTQEKGLATVWFTSWKYDRQEALWRAFIMRVIDGLYPKENGERISLENLKDENKKYRRLG